MPQEKAGSQIELNDGLTTLFSFNVFWRGARGASHVLIFQYVASDMPCHDVLYVFLGDIIGLYDVLINCSVSYRHITKWGAWKITAILLPTPTLSQPVNRKRCWLNLACTEEACFFGP
jgi:hypothetical protein